MSINLLAIVGPTATGKTALAVELAREFKGEIISADSRQVYCGMDIGTGKDLSVLNSSNINYHLIDIKKPSESFSVAEYQKLALEAIEDIWKRGKLPILVGGTGLYVQAIIDDYQLNQIEPDLNLRKKLEQKTILELFNEIQKLNPKFAQKINPSDSKNKRRLIRYIEILQKNNLFYDQIKIKKNNKIKSLIFGLKIEKEILKKRIYKRLIERLEKEAMVQEVENLYKNGLSWEKLESFGLEYRFIAFYLQHKISYNEMVEKLNIAICQFTKRQMTWLRRWEKQEQKIYWLEDLDLSIRLKKIKENFKNP